MQLWKTDMVASNGSKYLKAFSPGMTLVRTRLEILESRPGACGEAGSSRKLETSGV